MQGQWRVLNFPSDSVCHVNALTARGAGVGTGRAEIPTVFLAKPRVNCRKLLRVPLQWPQRGVLAVEQRPRAAETAACDFPVNHRRASPPNRMGGFLASSWLQLLLCTAWPRVSLILRFSFKSRYTAKLQMAPESAFMRRFLFFRIILFF